MASKKAVETPIDIMTMSLEQLQAHSQSQSEKIEALTTASNESAAKVDELTAAANESAAKIEELTTLNNDANTKIAEQESTIEELMGKVAALDAEPKVKAETIKIGKIEHRLTVPKSYVRVADGEPTMLCTIETCAENKDLQAAAIAKGLLVPVEKENA